VALNFDLLIKQIAHRPRSRKNCPKFGVSNSIYRLTMVQIDGSGAASLAGDVTWSRGKCWLFSVEGNQRVVIRGAGVRRASSWKDAHQVCFPLVWLTSPVVAVYT